MLGIGNEFDGAKQNILVLSVVNRHWTSRPMTASQSPRTSFSFLHERPPFSSVVRCVGMSVSVSSAAPTRRMTSS